MKEAFSFGGNLSALRVPVALDDPRSVVFGINHDTDSDIHDDPIYRYAHRVASVFATACVLAREAGVPLVLRTDNLNASFIPFGVKFQQLMRQPGGAGAFVKDNVLGVIDSGDVLFMERGRKASSLSTRAAPTSISRSLTSPSPTSKAATASCATIFSLPSSAGPTIRSTAPVGVRGSRAESRSATGTLCTSSASRGTRVRCRVPAVGLSALLHVSLCYCPISTG